MKHIYAPGVCNICGYIGTVTYHHIVPQRFNSKNPMKGDLYFMKNNKMGIIRTNVPLKNLMIKVCEKCHKRLHPENWMYHLNEILLEKQEQIAEENNPWNKNGI